METYFIILKIILQTLAGKNLSYLLNEYKENEDLPRIKNTCYGLFRNYYSINFCIDKLLKSTTQELRTILQIGIFELKYSNKPNYAVLNDLVNFAFEVTNKKSSKKFINGVLREFTRNEEVFQEMIEKDYSLKYNIPNWIISKLKLQNKAAYLHYLEGFNYHPAFGVRINDRKTNIDLYTEQLKVNNIDYNVIDKKIILGKALNVSLLPQFDLGCVSVQDIAAQYTIDILKENNINPHDVLDACSAPGGKTCQILENYECNLTALDIDKNRIAKVEQNLDRLNLQATTIVGNALSKNWWNGNKFDLILADVPCSASGTIKRNPDIKVVRPENDIIRFAANQRKIVTNLWDMLENNSYMLYVTCSIFNEENQDNVKWFVDNLFSCELIEERQIIPTEYNDSLYYALIYKK